MAKEFAVTSDLNRNINPKWFRVRLRLDELMPAYIWAEQHGAGDYKITTNYMIFEKEEDAVFCKLKFGAKR